MNAIVVILMILKGKVIVCLMIFGMVDGISVMHSQKVEKAEAGVFRSVLREVFPKRVNLEQLIQVFCWQHRLHKQQTPKEK